MRAYERGTERWEISLREQLVITRHFEHDELVDDSTHAHTTALRAKWEADRLCSRLANEGFVRAGAEEAPIGKSEFEDALCANPDDLETYLVYADWLSEHGDDWGQLIAVQHAQQMLPRFGETARRDELARTETVLQFGLASRLWGVLGETVSNEQTQHYAYELIDATWRCGFLRTARIQNNHMFDELVRALDELPIAIVLRELTLVDVTRFESIAGGRWRSLETLAIHGDRLDASQIAPVLTSTPRLRHLVIHGTQNSDLLCEAIATSPIVSQLVSIELRQGQFTRRGIDVLSTAPLSSLKTLELGATSIESRAKLQHLAPTVRVHQDG